jgi:hypothetical protein
LPESTTAYAAAMAAFDVQQGLVEEVTPRGACARLAWLGRDQLPSPWLSALRGRDRPRSGKQIIMQSLGGIRSAVLQSRGSRRLDHLSGVTASGIHFRV